MSRLLVLFAFFLALNLTAQCPVVPSPKGYETNNHKVYLGDEFKVSFESLDQHLRSYFTSSFYQITNIQVKPVEKNADLRFEPISIDFRLPLNDFYAITYSKLDKVIRFKEPESQLYGIVTFLQLLEKDDKGWFIRECEIGDMAKFEWRGLHLDVSRHFFTVEEVKRFIDLMTLYKFNKFHWHLTDDQGWRVEITKYPLLTEIGGYRDSTIIGHYADTPREWDRTKYGGFYTQDEIREVVAYAQSRYIDVVPEIEMPGHSRAALAAYPQFSCTGEDQPVPGVWGVFDDIYCSKEESIQFMKDVLAEVISLFPGEYIHIGGDEAPKKRWKECSDCQRVIKENGLKDEHELQSFFIRQIDDFLTSKGKKLIGWDEILEGGLSPNAAVMSWRGEEGGIEAATLGHEVVMTPTTYCYFDYYQSATGKEPLAIGGYLPLEKVYQFNPIPEGLPVEKQKFIIGGQANLWTEYITNMEELEYMAYPRALAMAQSLWCFEKPEYDQFLETVIDHQESFLAAFDVNYSNAIHYPQLHITRVKDGIGLNFTGASPTDSFYIAPREYISMVQLPPQSEEGYYHVSDTLKVLDRHDGTRRQHDYYFHVHIDDEILSYKIESHGAIGTAVELITKPHQKYDHNGGLNLVDGIRRGDRFNGTEWLGFKENRIEFILDHDINGKNEQINIGFLDQNGSWIYLPEKVTVFTSDDKQNWRELGSTDEVNELCSISYHEQRGKYIKVVIDTMETVPDDLPGSGNVPWTFIDEVFFKHVEK